MEVVGKTLTTQILIFCVILGLLWGLQALYAVIDPVVFPSRAALPANASTVSENEKGKLVLDAMTHQMRYEMKTLMGWTCNDWLFVPTLWDNRAYRQLGVYHATKDLLELYATHLAKMGRSGPESPYLTEARLFDFSIDPRSFWFPSAENSYAAGFKKLDLFKRSLDSGKGVYNVRIDDLIITLDMLSGENMLGFALGLLQHSQDMPFYKLDNHIYEVQGIALVIRDFLGALYDIYPVLHKKDIKEAIYYLDKICTYNPLLITSEFNSGELIISYLVFARNRIQDVHDSL